MLPTHRAANADAVMVTPDPVADGPPMIAIVAPAMVAAIVLMPSIAALGGGRGGGQAEARQCDRGGRGQLQYFHGFTP